MDETATMTVPPPLPAETQARDASQAARQTVSIRTISPSVGTCVASGPGATVFVGVSAPTVDSATTCGSRIPEVQSVDGGYEERSDVESHQQQQQQQRWQQSQYHQSHNSHHNSHHQQQQQQQQQQQAAHIVKIKINPDGDKKNSRVISTIRLTLDNKEHEREIENRNARELRAVRRADCGAVVVSATNLVNERHRESAGTGDGCVRISVYNGDPSDSDRRRERNDDKGSIASANDNDKRTGQEDERNDNGDMVHRGTADTLNTSNLGGRSSACFYYQNSYPLSSMVMSSGQCSPSETLDSGTCSDLDGTPPPLPKKKNASGTGSVSMLSAGTHNRTGSLTSSGAEVDSDDNESNISCDSLNGADALNGDASDYQHVATRNDMETSLLRNMEKTTTTIGEGLGRIVLANNQADHQAEKSDDGIHLEQMISTITETGSSLSSANVSRSPSDISSLSKASSTPRVRSPELLEQQQSGNKAVVNECTYEERKQQHEQERTECTDADHNRSSGHKYLYEDDRYYNFHVNELREKNANGEDGAAENYECFAGYKIHEKEAIRSAKGTVRGVKNRVRAGIATFLQSPTSKAYVDREKGKVVLYMTSLGIVRQTFTNCMKMKQILWTNMVKYEEADLFRDTDLQSELKDRTDSEIVTLPQLFVDGQHIGGVDTVERLNESGELRRILEPYQCKDACAVCTYCGGFQRLLCPICHGSKRSVHRNEFTVEFVALKCAKCDVFGMIRCPYC